MGFRQEDDGTLFSPESPGPKQIQFASNMKVRAMKLDKIILLLGIGLVLGWGVAATNDPVKVGFVDVERVLATSDKGKSARDELERKGREAQGRLAPIAEQLEAMGKELESKQFVMSEDAVRAKQLDMVELRNRYENKAKEEEGQFKIEQQRLLGPLVERLAGTIKEVGQDNGFSVILRTDTPGLEYRREALDVTELVIKSFNRKS